MAELPQVPITRTLPRLLRRELDAIDRRAVRMFLAKVVAVPDVGHVTILYAGVETVVPRLVSYGTATVGRGCYCLAAGPLIIALHEAG